MEYTSKSYRIFTAVNIAFLTLLSLLCLLPIIHILAVSLSDKAAADGNLVRFLPIKFTWFAYQKIFDNPKFINSFYISVFRSVVGTAFSMCLMTMAAYSLSKEQHEFKGRNAWAWFFVFTMLFDGGLIPTYIVVQKVGLMNSLWVLIIPGAVNVYNMILLLNYFRSSVPKALEESAFLDGAGYLTTLIRVCLPVSLPVIATISLFTMVYHWNEWFSAMIYLKAEKFPMATLLQSIISQLQNSITLRGDMAEMRALSDRTIRAAQIFIATVPIIVVYPFLQRYFVKGIVVGSVKG